MILLHEKCPKLVISGPYLDTFHEASSGMEGTLQNFQKGEAPEMRGVNRKGEINPFANSDK